MHDNDIVGYYVIHRVGQYDGTYRNVMQLKIASDLYGIFAYDNIKDTALWPSYQLLQSLYMKQISLS